jgi:hypothetical protein
MCCAWYGIQKWKKMEYKKEIPIFLCYLQVVMAELRHLFLIT